MNSHKPTPSLLGLKKSFGFGDRIGLATPGHIDALKGHDFAPIFAQQSIREMTRTQRTPEDVMTSATETLVAENWDGPWGADADHLKTDEDVASTAAAGFTFFTIDPSDFVNNEADHLSMDELETEIAEIVKEGALPAEWKDAYLGQEFKVSEEQTLRFDPETLNRAAVKYGRAIRHCTTMAASIHLHGAARGYEIEVSVDETDSPTSPLEHLFFGLELKRREVKVVSLAPRFIGDFEKGIDYKGDLKAFEESLALHVAVAKYCGPYKLSIHSGSDKFSIYPAIGRLCGDLLHVKTAGTSYLEAIRVVCHKDPELFQEIAAYSRECFMRDRKTYHLSTTEEDVEVLAKSDPAEAEKVYFDTNPGRQVLHVTFGSVLTVGKAANGDLFKDRVLALLKEHDGLHREFLARHLGKHLQLLSAEL
ncbi:MAG: tagaturonate epimerase family protein [Opitutales bacterium]|nr:tagaturonate epimerase family protein [Opitutales bacterium]